MIWTGTDDGVVSVTRDAGKTWANVTANFSGVPKWTYVADVVPSQHADGTAYVAFDGHRGGDYGTYAFVTTDFGATARSIAGNLPKGEVVRTILEDPKNADLLYLGTETGLWISHNRGGQWTRLKANLPTTPIYEMKVHPRDNDLILAAYHDLARRAGRHARQRRAHLDPPPRGGDGHVPPACCGARPPARPARGRRPAPSGR